MAAVTANANALCTRNEVKDFLSIIAVNNDIDDFIVSTINRISTAFESYCDRSFILAQHTEYHNGGKSRIFPKNLPLVSIDSVYEDSDWLYPAASLVASAGYTIVDNNHVYYDGIFETGPNAVKITYTAGYASDSIPENLKQACITETARIIKHRVDFDALSIQKEDGTVTFNNLNYLPLTQKALNHYRVNYIL